MLPLHTLTMGHPCLYPCLICYIYKLYYLERRESISIFNWNLDSPLLLDWLIYYIIFELGIFDLMTNKFKSLVMRNFCCPGIPPNHLVSTKFTINIAFFWPYCVIQNHFVTGSIIVMYLRFKFYLFSFIHVSYVPIRYTQSLFNLFSLIPQLVIYHISI